MTNTGKKLAALLLAVLMVVAYIPISVYAANSEYDKGTFEIDMRSGSEVKYHGGTYDTVAMMRCLEMAVESGLINCMEDGNSYYYDLDQNGSWDFQLKPADTFTFTRQSGCSLAGEKLIVPDQSTLQEFEAQNTGEYYYSCLAFEFPWEIDWLAGDISLEYNKLTFAYNGKVQKPKCILRYYGELLCEGRDYYIIGTESSAVGSYDMEIFTTGRFVNKSRGSLHYYINKGNNPLTVSGKTATVRYSKLKKKTQTLAVTKVIKFTKKLNDKKTYTLSSAKKGKKSFKKYFKINKTTGKVTIKKNTKMKKGTYKVKVKVKAAGNSNYKASATKTVTFTLKVK